MEEKIKVPALDEETRLFFRETERKRRMKDIQGVGIVTLTAVTLMALVRVGLEWIAILIVILIGAWGIKEWAKDDIRKELRRKLDLEL